MKRNFLLLASLGFVLAAIAAEVPATFKVSTFTFKRPDKWEWVESASPMRKAQLKVGDAKNSAEVVFFHFGPSNGGGVQANVERWFGQFEGPREKLNAKSEEVTVGKRKVTYVRAEGTYLSGMPGEPRTPQPNSALRGAIVESSEGDVFVKMTGPKSIVEFG